MKSVYIIAGGILVMVAVVVFLAPQKQNKTEEKASASLDEIDAIILKEYGADLTPENKEIVRQEIADRLARDKAEMRKYGRVLTPNERSEQWWREQDEAEERAAYAKLYEERKDWIDNFPFRPGYHPDILYDPENIAHSDAKFRAYERELVEKSDEAVDRYETESEKVWARTDLTREEKEKASSHLRLDVEEARNPDPEIMAERRLIMRHKRLAGFYKQHYRYFPEFEQAYRIFEEEGIADNPIRLAHTMVGLENYFATRRQANQHGLDELHPFQTRWEDPQAQSSNPQKNTFIGTRQEYAEFRRSRRPQRRRITWGELMEEDFHIVRNCVRSEWVAEPGEERPSMELAERIRDRLIAEVPPDGITGNKFLFGMADPKDEDMVPEQSLLVE